MSNYKDEFEQAKREFRKEWKKSKKDEHWWEDRTLPEKVVLVIGLVILGLGLAALFGWIIMALWNELMPTIFNLPHINYWQAWGLFILSMIFFKGMGSSSNNSVRSDNKRRRELRRKMRETRDDREDGDWDDAPDPGSRTSGIEREDAPKPEDRKD